MRASGRGRVILIGSDQAERAAPRASAYVAAKNAQIGLTKSWAKELGADDITVNLVQPGWIPVERHAGIDRGLRR
jgi:3-oxoacyl-[acyl-carrier protein] reductase